MSDTIDHKSGRPIDGEALVVGAGVLGAVQLVNLAVQHKEVIAAAGSALIGTVVANPKIAMTIAATAAAGYGIYRITQSGTKIEFGKFKYERK